MGNISKSNAKKTTYNYNSSVSPCNCGSQYITWDSNSNQCRDQIDGCEHSDGTPHLKCDKGIMGTSNVRGSCTDRTDVYGYNCECGTGFEKTIKFDDNTFEVCGNITYDDCLTRAGKSSSNITDIYCRSSCCPDDEPDCNYNSSVCTTANCRTARNTWELNNDTGKCGEIPCVPGQHLENGRCVDCPLHTYSLDGSRCIRCDPGEITLNTKETSATSCITPVCDSADLLQCGVGTRSNSCSKASSLSLLYDPEDERIQKLKEWLNESGTDGKRESGGNYVWKKCYDTLNHSDHTKERFTGPEKFIEKCALYLTLMR